MAETTGTAAAVRFHLNGEPRDAGAGTTVADVVTDLLRVAADGERTQGIAVAVDDEVVPRGRWSERRIGDGERVEVLGAVAGG
ncbi:sulfur carrier protein [Kineococcus xinjiangensis]|uniref:Sulfur carrier protein n=1 Tax=Kineococcus xinjiangensis TaxID=512762 RepID=A0A2S6IP45_9ACTN|nr:sulfur carrier protein ThiS [Kineococcus xinjiangensis]PPK95978.1 sulfur carrier protein [Kineococcus xinjiangensis]